MRKLLIGFIVVVLVSIGLYFRLHRVKPPLETDYAGNREVTLWSTTAQVRSPVATANFGDRLDVLSRFGDQVQVRTVSGITGWASERDLLSADFWQKSKELNASTDAKPVEARGRTRVLSNMHLEPGRDHPRLRQVNKNVAVDLYERRAIEVPSPASVRSEPASAETIDASSRPSAPNSDAKKEDTENEDARKEDWWLVRATLPDQTRVSGWILGRFIDLDVPEPLPDYASSTAMRIVAWFVLNHVTDSTGEMKPQYLIVGTRGPEGQACDFTLLRVLTWGNQRQRYETAFVESDVCGKLPLKLTQGAAPGADASFAFQDLSDGSPEERLYRMHQTIVRQVRQGGDEPVKRVASRRKR